MQKKVPYVAQLGNMDCSIACMTMLFRYYGLDVDIVDVGQVVHIGRDGVNLTQLKQATQQFGFKCTTAHRQTTIFSITSAICWIVKALLLPFMAMRWVALYNSRIIKSASRVSATGMTTPVLMLSA